MSDDNNDREARIQALQRQAAAAAGTMVSHESEEMTPDLRERFWRSVVAFETADQTDLMTELKGVGVELPDPDSVDDDALHAALWVAIEALARMNVFLSQTDHLDRDRLLPKCDWI